MGGEQTKSTVGEATDSGPRVGEDSALLALPKHPTSEPRRPSSPYPCGILRQPSDRVSNNIRIFQTVQTKSCERVKASDHRGLNRPMWPLNYGQITGVYAGGDQSHVEMRRSLSPEGCG